MGRTRFYLIYSEDPSAADVVREDFIVGGTMLEKDEECIFRWEKAKGEFENIQGKVVAYGLKKDMTQIFLDTAGNITNIKQIGTRKQEIEKRRLEASMAKETNLQAVSETLLDGGAAGACAHLMPVVKIKKPCLPKKRDAATLVKLKQMVDNMPCLKKGSGKTELLSGTGKSFYADSADLMTARLDFGLQPKKLHIKILKLLIPEEILKQDGISPSGSRGCVSIDSKLNSSVTLYVSKVYKERGGNPSDIKYSPSRVLKNLFENARKARSSPSASAPPAPSTSSTLSIPPSPSPATSSLASPVSSPVSGPTTHPLAKADPPPLLNGDHQYTTNFVGVDENDLPPFSGNEATRVII